MSVENLTYFVAGALVTCGLIALVRMFNSSEESAVTQSVYDHIISESNKDYLKSELGSAAYRSEPPQEETNQILESTTLKIFL